MMSFAGAEGKGESLRTKQTGIVLFAGGKIDSNLQGVIITPLVGLI